jgi:hypothetical protein
MENTVQRAVDVAPRAALAFLLALLAIPGSTLAWDLPAGGPWLGLPLAAAASLLGVASGAASPPGSRSSSPRSHSCRCSSGRRSRSCLDRWPRPSAGRSAVTAGAGASPYRKSPGSVTTIAPGWSAGRRIRSRWTTNQ